VKLERFGFEKALLRFGRDPMKARVRLVLGRIKGEVKKVLNGVAG
jgi:hypothetical protein